MRAIDTRLAERVSTAASAAMPDLLSLATRLIRVPSANPPGVRYGECVDILEGALRALGLEPTVIDVPGSEEYPRFSILAEYGSGSKVLHFHAHYDVVPAVRSDQYEPRVVDGKLYGRGASDMKGAVAAMLMAIGVLEQCGVRLGGRIRISLVPDEETGGKLGTGYLFARGHLTGGGVGMLMPEPTSGQVWNANRSALSLKVRTHGRFAHVGEEYKGRNAFLAMVEAVKALSDLRTVVSQRQTRLEIEPEEARRSILLLGGQCGGGVNFNAVPYECFFTIDRRANPEEGAEAAKAELLRTLEDIRSRGIDLDWEVLQEGDAACTPVDCELACALSAACRVVQGRVPRYVMCPALTELRFFARAGIPAFVFGPGLLEVSHGPDEYVLLENLRQACAIYALVAIGMLAGDSDG
jgi:acetylornithine deacetylase/succinyl-diaminopimelate desuccinylase family protein